MTSGECHHHQIRVVGVARHDDRVLFATLAATSADVAATRSRLVKRALIATAIRAAEPLEIALVVTYLSGTLRQRRTGVGWASLTSIPSPAAESTLTVRDVDAAFEALPPWAGRDPAACEPRPSRPVREGDGGRTASAARPGVRRDPPGCVGFARPGGLAEAFGVPAKAVQRASMLLGSTASAAEVLAREGLAGLEAVSLAVGVPVRPMLAASAPDVAGAIAKTGLPAVVDTKLDGIRVQVHRRGDAIAVYSRSLDDITQRVPEIVAAVAALPSRQLVLDGEVLAVGDDGRPLTFQVIASRTMTGWTPTPGRSALPCRCSASTCCTWTVAICWTSRSRSGWR